MLNQEEIAFFERERTLHEAHYLAGSDPRQQSGFGRDQQDWERFRRVVIAPIGANGSLLDIGCANGLLMESAVQWAGETGIRLEPYGLEISPKLAALAQQRLPHWRDRIFIGNALIWEPPFRFDYVRTELVYVPRQRRRDLVVHLMQGVVRPEGYLILCSYGSSRFEGERAENLVPEVEGWGVRIEGVYEARNAEYDFAITQVVSLRTPLMQTA